MRNIILKVLLYGGLFFTQISQANTVLSDKFVFKVSTEVFSVKDLSGYIQEAKNLYCIYPESLLFQVFKPELKAGNKKMFQYSAGPKKGIGSFSEKQKEFFKNLLPFAKLLVYSRSHEVSVNQGIVKFFGLAAKRNRCKLNSFNEDGSFKPVLREMVRLEVFMRSRFLPTEQRGKTSQEDITKAVTSSKSLMKSIGEQIEDEVYW